MKEYPVGCKIFQTDLFDQSSGTPNKSTLQLNENRDFFNSQEWKTWTFGATCMIVRAIIFVVEYWDATENRTKIFPLFKRYLSSADSKQEENAINI
jgi:hypothetical protein